MTDTTARLALPLLVPGQAQKELFHNEALALVDLALPASVVAVGVNAPPVAPALGDSWIVGTAPTGAWSGHAAALAGWTAGGWRFVAPAAGMAVWDRSRGLSARYVDESWQSGAIAATGLFVAGVQVVGAQRPAIADVAAGGTVDANARAVIAGVLNALRVHGLIAV